MSNVEQTSDELRVAAAKADGRTVPLAGADFEVTDRPVSRMAVLQYSKAAQIGGTVAAVAQYDLLHQVIAEADWDRFCEHANLHRCSDEDLWAVINGGFQVLTGRPTSRSGDSSPGPSSSEPSSTSAPAPGPSETDEDRVMREAEEAFPGRPDLQVVMLREQRKVTA